MTFVRTSLALLLVTILFSCADPEDRIERRQVFAVGTLVEITLVNPPDDSETALRSAEASLLAAELRWRAWDDGGLAAINRSLQETGHARADPEMIAGIQRALDIADASDGLFNPAIGKLVELWGFHQEERSESHPPSATEIVTLTDPPLDPANILIHQDEIRSDDSRIWLDMGAFAKGIAVETALAALKGHGISNAIVNAGGDLKTLGRHGERDWRIGVRHPSGQGVIASLDIAGELSVFTSGNYERRFAWEGETYHHILDPRSGYPARGFDSVTVVHADAALADAAATAVFVAGLENWQQIAQALGITDVMVVTSNGRIIVTPSLQARLHVEPGVSVETAR